MKEKNVNIITYHICKSTGVGGVERLIRHIQSLDFKKNYKFTEVYNDIYASSSEVSHAYTIVKYCKLHSGQQGNIFSKFFERLSVYFYFSKNKYKNDIIFLFHPEHLLLIPKGTLKDNRIILIQTNKFSKLFERFGKYAFESRMKYIDYLSVYTENDFEYVKKYYPAVTDRTKIIPRGCRIPTGNSKKCINYRLVTICRIDENQKNLSSMIRIVKNLPEEYTLDVYGVGHQNEISFLMDCIDEDTDRIRYLGEAKNIEDILSQYSLFLMTSNYEGFGQTLIEARSQGLPIVAFNTFDALSWIVKDGYNGRVIGNKDEELFRMAIIDILSDEEKFYSYSKGAIEMADSTEISTVSNLLIDMIDSCTH